MQNMAVDAEDQEESLAGFRKRLEAREFRYPLPYALMLPKTVAQQKTHFATSCSRTLYITLHHIITYKLLIVWLNITLSRGLII